MAAFRADPQDDRRVRLDRVRTLLAKDVRSSLLLFWGAVALVLLLACANVANLMLARAADRRREMAVRRALGVDAPRLVRQLLIEGVMLSLCGGAAGLGLAHWTVRLLVGISPATIPRLAEIRIDPGVVAFTAALSLATGIAFGLVPALQAARIDLPAALRDGDASSRRGVRMRRTTARSVILVLEVAVLSSCSSDRVCSCAVSFACSRSTRASPPTMWRPSRCRCPSGIPAIGLKRFGFFNGSRTRLRRLRASAPQALRPACH